MKVFATSSALAFALLAVVVPAAAATTQRISITFAVEGGDPGAGAGLHISDGANSKAGCHVAFTEPTSCGNGIPGTRLRSNGATVTLVDSASPSTRCFRVTANDNDPAAGRPSTPISVRATFTNPDGSQHSVGPLRMENGNRIYVGSTPAEPGLTPGGPPPTETPTCSGAPRSGPDCSDGFDNDKDRRVDFPTDIGCSHPNDVDEDNPHACDGIGRGLNVRRGTRGSDILNGTGGFDELHGLGGNDALNGRADGDCLYGGRGADRILGGGGRQDHIEGGPGNDRVNGQGGRDLIYGDHGNDVLSGGAGNDFVVGSFGNDRGVDHRGRDQFETGFGRDRIDTRDGRRDFVFCGPGRDVATVDRRDFVKGCEKVARAR
ncbi:MAG TPA: calcium-binding protein [Thermoleophilaceae bacterium]|nr:calcium-binding protein [Thermoleophilaceae bacterium]